LFLQTDFVLGHTDFVLANIFWQTDVVWGRTEFLETNLLLQKIEKLMIEKHLYDERETKLMGVIDYLESKVDGLAV
jgi:hypothetical protein